MVRLLTETKTGKSVPAMVTVEPGLPLLGLTPSVGERMVNAVVARFSAESVATISTRPGDRDGTVAVAANAPVRSVVTPVRARPPMVMVTVAKLVKLAPEIRIVVPEGPLVRSRNRDHRRRSPAACRVYRLPMPGVLLQCPDNRDRYRRAVRRQD